MSQPTKSYQRKRRHMKVRTKLSGTPSRPRLVVYRSNQAIYGQLIDDQKGQVLAASSSLKMKKKGVESAKQVGMELAKAAQAKKIKTCVFDRGG